MKKLFGKVAFLTLIFGLSINSLCAEETLTPAEGDSSKSATVGTVTSADVYEVGITWGSLVYDYTKAGTDSTTGDPIYIWTPVKMRDAAEEGAAGEPAEPLYSNEVYVWSHSTADVDVNIAWNSTINNVVATFDRFVFSYENICVLDANATKASLSEKTHYSNSTCTSSVNPESFNESSSYYMIASDGYGDLKTANATIKASAMLDEFGEKILLADVVGKIDNPIQWKVNLSGGNPDDVVESATIGTITITFDESN